MGVLPLIFLGLLAQVYAGPGDNAFDIGNSRWYALHWLLYWRRSHCVILGDGISSSLLRLVNARR